MALNDAFKKKMEANVSALIEHGTSNSVTQHTTFNAEKLDLPEGITQESMTAHVDYINELTCLAEVATSQIAKNMFEENNKHTTHSSTLEFGGFTINGEHMLRQKVEGESIFGVGTTAVDYRMNEDLAYWLDDQRTHMASIAGELFKEKD